MKSILRKYTALTAALLLLGGCIKEHPVDGVSGEGTITLRLSLPYGGIGDTRSIAAEPDAQGENRIDEVAILALTQKGSDWVFDYQAQIVGKVQTDGELTVTAKVREMPVLQQFVILVNATTELTAAAPARYEKITDIENRLVCSTGGGEWPANNNGDGNFTPFPMYARTAGQMVSASNSPIGKYDLIRMVARINVTLKAGISNFTLEEACLFNYRTAGYVSYGNSGFNGTKATTPAVPASGDHTGDPIKMPTVTYEAVSGAILSSIYTFESPAITSEAGRTKGTALVVGGYYGSSGTMSYYRIDLKADSDLSDRVSSGILRNHSYEIEIESVTGAGYGTAEEAYLGSKPIEFTVSVTDWGVETHFPLGLKIQPSANCYLVAPGETFGIPVFGQVQQAISREDLLSTWIDNDMDLKAHLLWSDNSVVNGVVSTSRLKVYKSSSADNTIMLVATGNKTGNAVVAVYDDKDHDGIYNNADEIKWSWHIWVTDYDPDKQINGTTHVYAGNAFTNPLGIYYNGGNPKRIMDRNLGATWTGGTPSPSAIGSDVTKAAKAYGLLYQWGRKDPFTPASGTQTGSSPTHANGGIVTIYNASGTMLSESEAYGTGVKLVPVPSTSNNLPDAVRNPMTFYCNGSPPFDWYTNLSASQNNNLWNDVSNTKSVYDPCPPGWRVPIGGATANNNPWAGFSDGNNASVANSSNQTTLNNGPFKWYANGILQAGYVITPINITTNATAGRYYTGNSANAWYPASGYRRSATGLFGDVGTYGYTWSSIPNGTGSDHLAFYSTTVNPTNSANRAYGFPVRCVQE